VLGAAGEQGAKDVRSVKVDAPTILVLGESAADTAVAVYLLSKGRHVHEQLDQHDSCGQQTTRM
jgi:hypothetical protein